MFGTQVTAKLQVSVAYETKGVRASRDGGLVWLGWVSGDEFELRGNPRLQRGEVDHHSLSLMQSCEERILFSFLF